MCGLGLSVKYFAGITPLILGAYFVYLAITGRGSRRPDVVKSLVLFSVFTVLTSFIWYLRQYIVLENPLFPFYYKIFGSGSLSIEALEAMSEKGIRASFGTGISLRSFFTLPWQLTMSPEKFGGEQLGPLFLAIVPAVIFVKGINKVIKQMLAFALVYFVLWFFVYQNLRFFLPLAAFLSIVASYVLVEFTKKKDLLGKIVWAAAGLFLVFSAAFCFHHNLEPAKAVLGLEKRESYLARNERSYEVSEYINKNLPEGAKILVVNEGHTFFIDKDNKREPYYWIFTGYDKKFTRPAEVVSFFKEQGFTHILYADVNETETGGGTRLTELLKLDRFKKEYLKQIYQTQPNSENANGVKYMVYEIKS